MVSFPRVKYIRGQVEPGLVFISRTATVQDLHFKLCRKIALDSDYKLSAEEIVSYSRLWKFEGDENFDDAK